MTASLHFLAANAMFQVIRPRTGYAGKVTQAIFAALRKGAKRRAVKENGLAWQELQNMLDAVWDFGPGSASPDRCRSLWAIEGLGFFEAERTYSNDGALPRLAVDGLPPVSASVWPWFAIDSLLCGAKVTLEPSASATRCGASCVW